MATASTPQMSRVPTPPDPISIPGYAGHRAHCRLSGRKPFVELKSPLLHSPEVQSSHRLVLQPAHGSCWGAAPPGLGACRAAGAQTLSCTAIPGYTGFIPRAQLFFAKTYSEICKEARSSFAQQRLGSAHEEQEQRTRLLCQDPAQDRDVLIELQTSSQHPALPPSPPVPHRIHLAAATSQPKLPVLGAGRVSLPRPGPAPGRSGTGGSSPCSACPRRYSHPRYPHQDPPEPGNHQGHPATGAAAATTAPCALPCAFRPQGSPYSMEDDDPQKYFISGFTGFVPRARFLIGTGYPITTNRALLEFNQMTLRKGGRSRTEKGGTVFSPLGKTYPTDRGLLPHYTGYVPGYKFQFGRTYGHLTHSALGQSTLEKISD